ncbi:Peroxidase [Parasponia andersonii]|uniref:peroxidase n=1 Tax=Parasponia andersonii TaxID=3476 RepID=A0A2P5BV26_PARAD|nr:Peroxidase [Parasponia andersonii]
MASSSFTKLLFISSLLVASHLCVFADVEGAAEKTVPIAKGLSWQFYAKSCPDAESIIRKELKKIFKEDIAQAAGLLRVHFHDCFVQMVTGQESRPISG